MQTISGQYAAASNFVIDPQRLIPLWNKFAASLPVSEMHLKTLMSKSPTVQGCTIFVEISNPAQGGICENVELLTFLRSNLGSNAIVIRTNLVEQAVDDASPYTAKQKLDAMVQENPALQELISRFGLGFD